MSWEAPEILALLGDADDIYLDRVSQIRMDRWTKGRVALVGDAAACVSLLAGEGSGLGMTEAYVLASELSRADRDHERAFAEYESLLRPFVADKQEAAMKFAGFFAPATKRAIWLRDLGVRVASVPWIARRLMGASLRDDIELPEYEVAGPAARGADAPTLWA